MHASYMTVLNYMQKYMTNPTIYALPESYHNICGTSMKQEILEL